MILEEINRRIEESILKETEYDSYFAKVVVDKSRVPAAISALHKKGYKMSQMTSNTKDDKVKITFHR